MSFCFVTGEQRNTWLLLTLMASVKIASIFGREVAAIWVCFCALASWLAERVAHAGMVFFTFFSFSLDWSLSLRKKCKTIIRWDTVKQYKYNNKKIRPEHLTLNILLPVKNRHLFFFFLGTHPIFSISPIILSIYRTSLSPTQIPKFSTKQALLLFGFYWGLGFPLLFILRFLWLFCFTGCSSRQGFILLFFSSRGRFLRSGFCI